MKPYHQKKPKNFLIIFNKLLDIYVRCDIIKTDKGST